MIKHAKLYITILVILVLSGSNKPVYSQSKKPRIRLKVLYVKDMPQKRFLIISARYRVKKKYIPAPKVKFDIYHNLTKDSSVLIGKVILSRKGSAKLKLPKQINNLNFTVVLADTLKYKKASKTLNLTDANLETYVIKHKGLNYLEAKLTKSSNNEPIQDAVISLVVKRTFKSLNLGDKEFYLTDKEGKVKALIPKNIPAINGVLTLNALLDGENVYGTVKAFTVAHIGITAKENKEFDERKLWSAKGKEPIFLTIIAISLIVVVSTAIFQVVYNIYRISKTG